MPYVLAIAVALILYLASLTMSLVGPAPRGLPGTVAFLMTLTIVALLGNRHKAGVLKGIVGAGHPCYRLRPLIWGLMIGCVVVSIAAVIGMVIASGDGGVADADPVFDVRTEYRLNNHGQYTIVPRWRYLIVGSSFTIGWHTFGMLFALFGLHLALFGDWPPAFGPDQPVA